MLTRSGPFYIFEIARAVARLPGRAEVDEQEAHRLAGDMYEWYSRGEFRDCEVVVPADDPISLRPLAEVIEDARCRDPKWCLSDLEWNRGVMLTAPAVQRYLEGCGFTGAPRVLREWFGAASGPGTAARKPGRPPVLRQRLAEQMLDDLRSKRRTLEQLLGDTLAALVAQYGGSPNTADNARQDALEIFRFSVIVSENDFEH
jgi:hypothetical protein